MSSEYKESLNLWNIFGKAVLVLLIPFVCLTFWVKRPIFSANNPKAFFSPSRAFKDKSTEHFLWYLLFSFCILVACGIFEKGRLGPASTLDCDVIASVLQHVQSILQGTGTLQRKLSNFKFLFPHKNCLFEDEDWYLNEEKVSPSNRWLASFEMRPQLIHPDHLCGCDG